MLDTCFFYSYNTIIIDQLNIHVNTFGRQLERLYMSRMVNHCGSDSLVCLFIASRKLHQAVWDTSLRYSHNSADSADAEAVALMEEVLVAWDDSVGMLVMQSGYA